ncbi:hypothetical protein V7056_03650, partial [Bacillus sp. JJ664]
MKIKQFSFAFLFFYFFFLTFTLTSSADHSKQVVSPKTIQFKGENTFWSVDFREYVIGTEISLETFITYKGSFDSLHTSSSRFHTFISDNQFGGVHYRFTLNRQGKYHMKPKVCYGCQMLNNQE